MIDPTQSEIPKALEGNQQLEACAARARETDQAAQEAVAEVARLRKEIKEFKGHDKLDFGPQLGGTTYTLTYERKMAFSDGTKNCAIRDAELFELIDAMIKWCKKFISCVS